MRYRAEIDGLRAVAVVPVILFHAGIQFFSGGFVGVDVFFVISGYLITTIILSELEEGKFSLVNFYERRARRILPALFFMMAVCVPFAWMWLMPQNMKSFAQSLVAVSTFSSNLFFARESGYFDTAAELKPLLHTWSLAVEEQYYILFPLLLMLMWRLGKRWILVSIVFIGLASLLAAHFGLYSKQAANFYLLPTRAWELLLGALLAFCWNKENVRTLPFKVNQFLSLLGLILVGSAIFLFDKETPFPSLYTLVPVLGTVLIILSATEGTIACRLLANRLFVGIGLISYSAYLWHQPLLAFARHQAVIEHSPYLMFSLCVATMPLAYLSWRFIEKPFRSKASFGRRFIFSSSALVAAVFIGFGLYGKAANGFEKQWIARLSEDNLKMYKVMEAEKKIHRKVATDDTAQDNGDCRFNVRNITSTVSERLRQCHARYGEGVVILGDSHAIDLYGVVAVANPEKDFLFGLTKGSCRPHERVAGCQYDEFLSFIEKHPDVFSRVIYEQAAFYLLRTDEETGNREMFRSIPLSGSVNGIYPNLEYIKLVHDYLVKLSHIIPVTWFGSRVEPHISENDILQLGCHHPWQLRQGQYEVFLALDNAIEGMVGKTPNLAFVSQNKVFDYSFPRDFMTCDVVYWSDGDHLSTYGEQYFSRRYNLLGTAGE